MSSLSTLKTGPQAALTGMQSRHNFKNVTQFRGIKYANVPSRWALSTPVPLPKEGTLDCTKFGPICPQAWIDPRILLRIPAGLTDELEPFDEFECCNLTVTMPSETEVKMDIRKLPVLIWIHGGSQAISLPSPASRICDMRPLVAASISHGQPIIVVSLNYRLSIFAFGDGNSNINLALKDQRQGIDWVKENISIFGGDKDNITLAGESAGGVYTHAHLFTGVSVKRAIMQSGHLPLSPPLSREIGQKRLASVLQKSNADGHASLMETPAESLVNYVRELGWASMWLQKEGTLTDWAIGEERVDELMLGDCEYESNLWRSAFDLLTVDTILSSFKMAPEWCDKLAEQYGVYADRPQSAKVGSLDFLNDYRFAKPVADIAAKWREGQRAVYQYVVDQANPWQHSSRAHHGVELPLLFGGYDLSFDPAAEEVGRQMRAKWISFINGRSPWQSDKIYAFGPLGECKEIDNNEYSLRRRVAHFKLLQSCDPMELSAVYYSLGFGRISLSN
ncbi:catalytic protein [Xylogone sp. PMI_703]|nr:catalytic protein [Xylogone sp. PMI_703]